MEYATNPKATFDYEILETMEAGIVLSGSEVKSIKTGRASIKGAYVKILQGTPYLVGAVIAPYQPGNMAEDYSDQANRKLLIKHSQLASLIGLAKERGSALVPMKLYGTRGLIKLQIGIARGKKSHDKRATIARKDVARSKQRGTYEE
jgi:SsrA-binding protein